MGYRPSPVLIEAGIKGLTATLRFHRFGSDHLRAAVRASPTGTAVFCCWHQSLLTMLGPHRSFRVAVLASLSKDGEIMTSYLRKIGFRVARGSSSRGGAGGVKGLIEALHEGWLVVLTVDGPRGPFKQVKEGALELGRRLGVPVIPVAARATRELTFKRSWDRFRVPVPLSHVALMYGEALWFRGGEVSDAERAADRLRLANAIHALEARASALTGQPHT